MMFSCCQTQAVVFYPASGTGPRVLVYGLRSRATSSEQEKAERMYLFLKNETMCFTECKLTLVYVHKKRLGVAVRVHDVEKVKTFIQTLTLPNDAPIEVVQLFENQS